MNAIFYWLTSSFALRTLAVAWVLFLFAGDSVHAQSVADPDSMTIESVRAYSGTINTGDMLVVVEYRIDYTSLPSLAATDAFLCRFFVSSSEVNAASIVAFNDLGYGLGVCSMYFTAIDLTTASIEFENPNAEDYDVIVQGTPSAFTTPPKVETATITYRDSDLTAKFLMTDISDLAESLENDSAWLANGLDLITFTTGQQVLTATGEAYFGLAVPNLQIMIPDLFGSSTTSPEVFEREYGNSEEERLLDLWRNSAFGPFITELSTAFQLSEPWILALAGLVAVGAVVWFAQKFTGAPEFGLLTIPFSFPLVTAAGLGTLTAVMFVTALGIIGLMFSLFLRRAS